MIAEGARPGQQMTRRQAAGLEIKVPRDDQLSFDRYAIYGKLAQIQRAEAQLLRVNQCL